ncbi:MULTISPECIES: GntR family transcriptional regulator [environmental samples]|uniref:GntR family transcriptional regulator n=1 Tax=environmental samples TaxID=876090 RepID=UPI00033FD029|nr:MULTISPECIES: GntR family transcriptional regulator [environmental samples]CDC73571.1 transcriptional regulator GntR family [Oscillibacter sp. CAG:155]
MAGYTLLQEEAYAHIKEQILTGALQEDQIYSETRIAAMIGISRTPVKDALVRLNQERLVDILPSRGFRLHRMSEDDIWDTYQVRTAVEGFCVVHLAHRKDTPEGQAAIAELERSIARMEALADAPLDQLWQEDLAFHSRLVAFSGNQEFSQLFESCNHRMSVIAKQSFQSPNRRQAAIGEHRAILEAIRTCTGRDDLTAYGALRTHMEASRDIVLREQISR